MKVFGTIVTSYMRGRSRTEVYYGEPRRGYSIVRNYVYPRITANNTLRGAEMKQMGIAFRSANGLYRADGVAYMAAFAQEHPPLTPDRQNPNNFFAIWIKGLHAWQIADPTHVDLTALTVNDMASSTLILMLTVKDMIDNGYIPYVSIASTLTATVDGSL